MRAQNQIAIAHLYRRAGFGLSRAELAAKSAIGFDACVEELLHPERVEDPLEAELARMEGEIFDLTRLEDAQGWWLYRMIHGARPLEEKLTLFWHNHFATGASKVDNVPFMVAQNRTLRKHALASFGELLLAVSRDPAMLEWLDNAQSSKKHPNENFARELMELFTLGIGEYGEFDVREAARAFTGWKHKSGAFFLDAKDHDADPKTLFGETRDWSGEDVLATLAKSPATAARLASKLVRYFVDDDGSPELEARVAKRYLETGGDLRETVGAILRSTEFVSDRAIRAKVKSPVEFAVGAIRELASSIAIRELAPAIGRMGQALFNPPSVKGWDEGLAWIDGASLFERANFANQLATQRGIHGDGRFEIADWAPADADGARVIENVLDALLDGRAEASTRAALEAYVDERDKEGKRAPLTSKSPNLDEKVRGLVRLVLAIPEYQLA
jgi:uncharacterized protein (DUF1800 family)